MVKKRIFIILLIAFVLLFSSVAYAEEDIFGETSGELNTSEEVRAEKYSFSRYTFDTDDWGIIDGWAYPLLGLTNALFGIQWVLARVGSLLLQFSFNFYLFDMVANLFDSVMISLGNAIFYPYLPFLLTVSGLVTLVYIGIGRVTSGLKILGNFILIMAAVFLFLQAPSSVMKTVNNISDEVSGELIRGTASVVNPQIVTSDDAIVTMSNTFWEITVEKPWSLIQTGQMLDETQRDAILSYDVGSKDREDANKPYTSKGNYTPTGQLKRLGLVILLLLLSAAQIIGILLVTGLTVMYQFASLFSSFLIIPAALVALIPNQGFRVLMNSFYTVFSFLGKKLGNVLMLSIYFVISGTFYSAIGSYGWGLIMLLQTIALIVIIVFRGKILGFADTLTKGQSATIANIRRKTDPFTRAAGIYSGVRMYGMAKGRLDKMRQTHRINKNKDLAGKYLDRRYSDEKRRAEQVAAHRSKESGKNVAPEYSDYVKKVHARVANGYKPHSQQDIEKTAAYMADLKRNKEDPNALMMVDPGRYSDSELSNAQLNMERSVETDRSTLESRIASNKLKMNKIIKGTKGSMHYKASDRGGVINMRNGNATNQDVEKGIGQDQELASIHQDKTIRNSVEQTQQLKKVVNGNSNQLESDSKKSNIKEVSAKSNTQSYQDLYSPSAAARLESKTVTEKDPSTQTVVNKVKEQTVEKKNIVESTENVKNVQNKNIATENVQKTTVDQKTINDNVINSERVNNVSKTEVNRTVEENKKVNEKQVNVKEENVTTTEKNVVNKNVVNESTQNINETNSNVHSKYINTDEYKVMGNSTPQRTGTDPLLMKELLEQKTNQKRLVERMDNLRDLYSKTEKKNRRK